MKLSELFESVSDDAIISTMKRAKARQSYVNCKLSIQLATGIDEFDSLKNIQPSNAKPGDILAWGIRHYAILLNNDKVVDVPEWGGEVEIKSLNVVNDEYDEPTIAFSINPETYKT